MLKTLEHVGMVLQFLEEASIVAEKLNEHFLSPQGQKYELKTFFERHQTIGFQGDLWAVEQALEV